MPGNGKDLKKEIFEAAMALFAKYRYEEVEMRQIASKCNIAVGTLYNYYANKRQLFTDILISTWRETLEQFDIIDVLNLPLEEKIHRYVTALYDDIVHRRGLMYAIAKSDPCEIYNSPEILEFKKALMSRVKALLKDVPKVGKFSQDENIEEKMGLIAIISAVALVESYGDDREENIECLKAIVSAFIKVEPEKILDA